MYLIKATLMGIALEVSMVGFCIALYRLIGVLARHGIEALIGCAAALAAGALLRK
jgi:hypothetical protein